MEKNILSIILFFFSLSVFSQEVLMDSASASMIQVPKSYELKGDSWTDWNKIYQDWMKREYHKILKENKLKMNCSGCENIFLDVVLNIDSTGKMTFYKLVNSNKCSEKFSKKLEIQFMKSFFNLKFPPSLRNMYFEARLGTGLKC
ncbi:MAG TPA: hypothetical protein VJI69_02165 [Bacteroidia bacterium]|nr:hypothetical protein [Bacteroidia bacterium]